ncbi:MAG: hypothetical protein QXW60_04430 [Nitrososphaerota archaeon]
MKEVDKKAGFIDVDGSGLPLLYRLLRGGWRIRYSSFMRRPLKGFKADERRRKLIASAVNSGQLVEGRLDEVASSFPMLVISHIRGLVPDIDRRDLGHIYQKICESAEIVEMGIVHVGVHELGFMNWINTLIEQHGFKGYLYYLPHPLIIKRKIPVGGPPIRDEARDLVSSLTGRAQLFPGLPYTDAEAITLTWLLKEAAAYAAYVEAGLILYKRAGVLHTEIATQLLGGGRGAVWRRMASVALLTLLEDLEDSELQKSMLAGSVVKVLREGDKTVADILLKRLGERKSPRILVVGCRLQSLEKLKKRFKVYHVSSSEVGGRRVPQKVDAAILSVASRKLLEQLKELMAKESLVIDLANYRIVRHGGNGS